MAKNTVEIIITAKDDASATLKGIGGKLGGLGKAVGVTGLALGGAGVAVAGGLLALAKSAAPLEGIQAAFEGLTGTIEGGSADMLKALEEGSDGMIAQGELMRNFNEASQLVSVDFAKRLPKAMKFLSKVSASTGQDLDFLLSSLTTGVGRLSPMILDNLGIQVDQTAASAAYAEQIGKTVGELTKQEQQTALMNQVMEKLAINTELLPDLTGTATQQMAQFDATLENTKDQIGLALLPILTELMEAVSTFASENLPKLVEAFRSDIVPFIQNSVIPAIASLVGWIGTNLPIAFGAISAFWESTLKPAFETIGNFITSVIVPALQAFAAWLEINLPIAFAALQTFWISTLKPALEELKTFVIDTVIPALGDLADWFLLSLPTAFQAVVDFWNSILQPALLALQGFVSDTLIPAISELVDWIGVNAPTAYEDLKTSWEKTLKPALDAFESSILSNVIPALSNLFDWMGPNFQAGMRILKSAWENIGKPVLDNFLAGLEVIKGVIELEIALLQKLIGFGEAAAKFIFGPGTRQGQPGAAPGVGGGAANRQLGGITLGTQAATLHRGEAIIPLNTNRGVTALADALGVALERVLGGGSANNFNLTVNTTMPSVDVIGEFDMMKAFANA